MIKNEQTYYAALKEVSPLYDLDPPDGSEEARKLEELSTLMLEWIIEKGLKSITEDDYRKFLDTPSPKK